MVLLFDVGYGLTAIGYLGLVFLMLAVRKKGLAKLLLIAATLVTFAWSVSQITLLGFITSINQFAVLDSIRLWVWTLFLAACLQNQFSSFWQLISRPITLALLVLPTASIGITSVYVLGSNLQHLVLTLVTIQMLVILEQVYRQSGSLKWEYKPLIIYLAALTTFDFFTYANAAMVAQLNFSFFAARGYIYLAMLPFLVLAIRRIQHWGIDIFVSREVVMNSTLLLLSGAYLIIMALLGYVVQYFGGDWGAPIQIALFLIAIVLLLSLFLSHEFRTKLKVFITKNFYANQFDYRVEWVALTQRLSKQDKTISEIYKTALNGWMQGIKYDQGVLLKVTNSQVSVAAITGDNTQQLYAKSEPDIEHIQAFLEIKSWIIDFDEMRVKPELYNALPNRYQVMLSMPFQMVVPIYQQQALWGMVLLNAQTAERRALNWELRDYLQAVTEQTANFIFQAESAQKLTENAQFAAFSRMSAFVVHDLKNVLAQINLLLTNSKQHRDNPEFIDDTFETLGHAKARMDNMLRQLMDKSIDNSPNVSTIDMITLIQQVIDNNCAGISPMPIFLQKVPVNLDLNANKFANVLYHLVSNAQQATASDGRVEIKLSETTSEVHLDIEDTGTGMSIDFINEKLFTPFVTTKGNAGMGVGAYDAKTYLESIGGSIAVKSQEGEGSVFRLTLPRIQE
ncbi:MAG: putative PEP-CTERM system histidine kinase [Alphaproteobacteria bacterium]|jgi:putative PEP-CTERM system histidine kinase